MKVKRVNRYLAALLAAVMIFTSADFSVFAAGAVDEESELWKATMAEIVAEYYGFSDVASSVAGDEALGSAELYSSKLPGKELVNVDSEEKMVYADDYTYTDSVKEYNWKPVSASVIPLEGGDEKSYAMERNTTDSGAEVSYVTDASSYRVEVAYDLNTTISGGEQEKIFNVLTNLSDGVSGLEELKNMVTDVYNTYQEISAVETLLQDSFPVEEYRDFWEYWDKEAADAYAAALDEMQAYLSAMEGYDSAQCVSFMLGEDYPELQTQVSETYEAVSALYDAFANVSEKLGDSSYSMSDYCDMLKPLKDSLEPFALAESWPEVTEDDVDAEKMTDSWQASVLDLAEEGFSAPTDTEEVLKAASYSVSREVSLCKVTVTVAADLALEEIELGGDADGALSEVKEDTVLYLPVGTTDIQERIRTVESELLAGDTLSSYGLDDAEKYIRSEDEDSLPEEIESTTDDFEYIIRYQPVKYAVTIKPVVQLLSDEDTIIDYYYGTSLKLPEAGEDTSYDFVVQKEESESYYSQGDSVLVDGAMTITCYEGAEKKEYTYTSLLAQDVQYGLSDTAREILSSDALVSDTTEFRVPSDAVIGSIEGTSLDGYSVSLEASYRSGMGNAYWEPYKVTVMGGDAGTEILATAVPTLDSESGKYTAVWNTDREVTHVLATYRLKVKEDEQVTSWLGMPAKLSAEVQEQNALIDTAGKLYEKLKDQPLLNSKTVLKTLNGSLKDQTIITELIKDESQGGCWTDKSPSGMAIYRYLDMCTDSAGKVVLSQYYRQGNGAAMAEQARRLRVLLERLIADEGLPTALTSANISDIDGTISKIRDLIGYLKDLEGLKNLDSGYGINMNASGFDALIASTINAGTIDAYTGNSIYAYYDVQKNRDGIVTLKASVKVGEDTKTSEGYNVVLGEEGVYTLTDTDRERIDNMLNGLEEEWKLAADEKVDGKYYAISTDQIPESVDGATSVVTVIRRYVPNTYTVKTEDGSYVRTFAYGGADRSYTIDLESYSNDASEKEYYRYTINGNVRYVANGEDQSYTFKKTDLASFGNSRTLMIDREKTTAQREMLKEFLDGLNSALDDLKDAGGNRIAAFVPVEKDGEYQAVILRILSSKDMELSEVVSSVAAAFQNVTYDYVGLDGKDGQTDFLYSVKTTDESGQEVENLKMKPQALMDVLLNSDISSESLLALINADGSVNEFNLEDGLIADTGIINGASLGGKLTESSLYLGTSRENCDKLKLYVTVAPGDNTNLFKDTRKAIEDSAKYVTFALDDGSVQIKGTMPENVYKVYLSVMVLLGEKDLKDLDSSLKDDVSIIEDALKNLLDDRDKINAGTVEETLRRVGVDVSLQKYESLVNRIIKVILDLLDEESSDHNPDITVTEDVEKNQFGFILTYDAKSMMASIGEMEIIEKMLEGNTTIVLPVEFTIANFGKEYEALLLDTSKSGIDKVNYVEDLTDALANAEGQIYAVLLKDINGDLTINKGTILNLCGKTLDGDIIANASLRIIDSTLDSSTTGTVTGDIICADGKKVVVGGGRYDKNVEPFLGDGYVQNADGAVVNKYYQVSVDEEENIVVTLNTEFADVLDDDFKTLGLEIISDVLFNIHVSAKAVVDGKELYSVNIDDLLGVVSGGVDSGEVKDILTNCIDKENVTWLVKDLADKFSAEGLAEALESEDAVLASYEYVEAPWFLKLDVLEDGDKNYIGVGVEPGAEETHKLTVKFDKADEILAAMFRDIAKILTVNTNFRLGNVSYTDGTLFWDGEVGAEVTVDLESKDSTSSDYVTVLAVILAHDSEDRAAYATDIRLYEENIYAESLKKRINDTTVREFVDAMKAAEQTEFVKMVQDLDIPELLTEAVRLESVYNTLLEVSYDLIEKIDKFADSDDRYSQYYDKKLVGLYSDEKGYYTADWKRTVASEGSVALTVNLKLFAENYDSSVEKVIELIDEIPAINEIYDKEAGIDNREEYVDMINAAREAYNKLDSDAKKLVSNYDMLIAAEALYAGRGIWVAEIGVYNYTGSGIKPQVRVYENSTLLKKGVDYTVSYRNNLNAYNITGRSAAVLKKQAPAVVVKFIRNYTGTKEYYFTINRITVSKGNNKQYCAEVGLEIDREVYKLASDKAAALRPAVYLNGKKVSSTEYTAKLFTMDGKQLTSKNKMVPGTYRVVIYGSGKNITGTYGLNGEIVQIVGDKWIYSTYAPTVKDKAYTGQPIYLTSKELGLKYNGKSLLVDVATRPGHYTVTYLNNTEIGTATAIITGSGKRVKGASSLSPYAFTGTKLIHFNITGETLASKNVILTSSSKTYSGSPITLTDTEYTVKNNAGEVLTKDVDYTVSYKNNINAGTATVYFKGLGKYAGTVTKTFKIKALKLTEDMLVTGYPFTVSYQKGGVTPYDKVKLSYHDKTLVKDTDYTIVWTNNDKAGEASFVVKGKGNFTGSLSSKTFAIEKGVLASTIMSAQGVLYVADKKNNFHTTVRLRDRSNSQMLVPGTDYKNVYYYYWNTEMVTGIDEWVKVDSGKSLETTVKKVIADTYPDYSESQINKKLSAIQYFKMKVKVYGCGNYLTGSLYVKEAKYRVSKYNFTKCKVNGTAKNLTYNGKAQTLKGVTLYYGSKALVEGTDYSVKYTQNTAAGTVTATLTGQGRYVGVKKITYKINPKPVN